MTPHATSTYTAPHVVCLVSQVVSEWCEVVCWYKCVTVRSCEQLLHWRRDSPSLTEGFPLLTPPVVPVCGSVDWPRTLLFTWGRKAWYLHTACAESALVYTHLSEPLL